MAWTFPFVWKYHWRLSSHFSTHAQGHTPFYVQWFHINHFDTNLLKNKCRVRVSILNIICVLCRSWPSRKVSWDSLVRRLRQNGCFCKYEIFINILVFPKSPVMNVIFGASVLWYSCASYENNSVDLSCYHGLVNCCNVSRVFKTPWWRGVNQAVSIPPIYDPILMLNRSGKCALFMQCKLDEWTSNVKMLLFTLRLFQHWSNRFAFNRGRQSFFARQPSCG